MHQNTAFYLISAMSIAAMAAGGVTVTSMTTTTGMSTSMSTVMTTSSMMRWSSVNLGVESGVILYHSAKLYSDVIINFEFALRLTLNSYSNISNGSFTAARLD